MSTSTATVVTVFAVIGSVGGLLTLQAFWIGRMFDSFRNEVVSRFDAVGPRFDAVSARFDAVDTRFDAINNELKIRFDGISQRFDRVDARLDKVEAS